MVWLFVVSERAGEQSRGSGTLRISASSPLRFAYPFPSQLPTHTAGRKVRWLGKLVHHKSRRRWKYSQIVIITSSPHTKSLNGGGVGLENIAVHLKIGERTDDLWSSFIGRSTLLARLLLLLGRGNGNGEDERRNPRERREMGDRTFTAAAAAADSAAAGG